MKRQVFENLVLKAEQGWNGLTFTKHLTTTKTISNYLYNAHIYIYAKQECQH